MHKVRAFLVIGTIVLSGGFLFAAQPQQPASPPPQKALVDKYCVTCHNERLKTGGLVLDKMDLGRVPEGAAVWEKVIRKLRGGMMPPQGTPRPDQPTIDSLATWLETSIDRAAAANPNPGRVGLHRLNRTEYGNAIRDLLDLDVPEVAALLPPDDDSDGFDNIASVLRESPSFLESDINAAREASRLAVGDPASPVAVSVFRVPAAQPQYKYVEGMPLGTRGGVRVRHYFPLDGEYQFSMTLRQSQMYVKGLEFPHTIELTIDGERVFTGSVGGEADLKAQDQQLAAAAQAIQSRFQKLRFKVKAGPHTVIATFLERDFAVSDDVLEPFERDISPSGGMNGIPAVDRLEIMGPFKPTGSGDTASRRRIFVCHPTNGQDELPCARKIITALERRAFRKPVTEADLETPLSFYQKGRNQANFEKGIQSALQYILASPQFLYRAEQDPAQVAAGGSYRIGDLDLASRLSFFLWSSVPDDELLNLAGSNQAGQGKLKDPAVFEKQVRRMLADPKSKALVTNFGGQWLGVRGLAGFDPDNDEFPNFEENLRRAMQQEIELFLGSIVREDRSITDLMQGNYTFVNERLAQHYGIQGVRGDQFRRVTLTDENRWGLLGKGSVLAVTSYPNRTSPVLRGRWILENIMGTPPADPPPNVPPLKENVAGVTALSVRQLMEQHRANPTCASCHRIMDPLGFSLENYDAVGGWRSRDHGNAVDASGTLADGTPVNGPAALRKALMKRPEQFVRTMTEKLLTYALGRSLAYYDMPTVRAIVHEAAGNDYRFSSIVMGIVKSTPFEMRKAPETANPAVAEAAPVSKPARQ
jgi:hypothetical protein